MNPEYEESELERALQWAIWSTEAASPTCVLAIYPRWSKARYMNLLAHPNVRVLVRFARGTFAFLPPDHWAGGISDQVQILQQEMQPLPADGD